MLKSKVLMILIIVSSLILDNSTDNGSSVYAKVQLIKGLLKTVNKMK